MQCNRRIHISSPQKLYIDTYVQTNIRVSCGIAFELLSRKYGKSHYFASHADVHRSACCQNSTYHSRAQQIQRCAMISLNSSLFLAHRGVHWEHTHYDSSVWFVRSGSRYCPNPIPLSYLFSKIHWSSMRDFFVLCTSELASLFKNEIWPPVWRKRPRQAILILFLFCVCCFIFFGVGTRNIYAFSLILFASPREVSSLRRQ